MLMIGYVTATVFVFGRLLEGSVEWTCLLELARCATSLSILSMPSYVTEWSRLCQFFFHCSIAIWAVITFNNYVKYLPAKVWLGFCTAVLIVIV